MDDSGNFSKDDFMAFMEMATENKTALARIDEVATACKDKKDPNNM